MKFDEVLNQAIAMLQRQRRISYRALRRQFQLDDQYLEDLKAEIVEVLRLAVDEDGKMLVWTGGDTPSRAVDKEQASNGAHDSGAASPAVGVATEVLRGEAERRQLTVMFCDLVDSTTLSARLDPEDLGEIIRDYQQAAAEIVARFGGHIAQYLGDGLLVYFGYPLAHEDDALRAVRSALEILTAMAGVNARIAARHRAQLAVRISIHTGPVVVGEIRGGRRTRAPRPR